MPRDLRTTLMALGWVFEVPVAVMVRGADATDGTGLAHESLDTNEVRLSRHATPEWQRAYRRTLAHAPPGEVAARLRLAVDAPAPKAYASAGVASPVAVGVAVMGEGWMGIFDVATMPESLRQGHATRVVRALSAWGSEMGGGSHYLQVAVANVGARSLYERLGYRTAYTYVYAVPGRDAGQ
ncbi:hypothetical protein BH23DEI1_BH23DEI1_05880 [soil metagenome]